MLQKAQSGDQNAAFNIAKVHEKFSYEGEMGDLVREAGKMQGFSMQGDRATALYWYKVAADSGHKEALQAVFEGFYFGSLGLRIRWKQNVT